MHGSSVIMCSAEVSAVTLIGSIKLIELPTAFCESIGRISKIKKLTGRETKPIGTLYYPHQLFLSVDLN